MSLVEAFSTLLQGLGLIGNAITFFIQFLFGLFGISVPSWLISIAAIIVLLISILTIGRRLGKIVLIVLICIVVSLGAGLLSGLLQVG
jgi:hypothetical protein